jgi:NitT/TauT family transport system substrate-binding protein
MRHLMKYSFSVILALGISLQSSFSMGAEEQHVQPVKLKLAILPYLSYAPFFIAQDEGFFVEQGIQTEVIQFTHSPDAIPALARGQLDVAGGFITVSMLNAMAQGARIKFVADKSYSDPAGCTYMGLVARRTLVETGKLADPVQLKGCRVAINEASIEGYWVEKVLKTAGLALSDIRTGDIPDAAMLSAFEKGAIDLGTPAEPWITRVLDAGHAVMWKPIQHVVPGCQFGVILFGPNLLDKSPETGKRFMAAYVKAVQQYNQGKTKRNLEILAAHTGLDPGLLTRACWPSFRADGRINPESVLDFQAWAVEKGYLDRSITPEQFWDPRFVDCAERHINTRPQ